MTTRNKCRRRARVAADIIIDRSRASVIAFAFDEWSFIHSVRIDCGTIVVRMLIAESYAVAVLRSSLSRC